MTDQLGRTVVAWEAVARPGEACVLWDLDARVGVEAPWAHPRAAEYDAISWHHWLRSQSDDESACEIVSIYVAEAMLTKPAHAFSLR